MKRSPISRLPWLVVGLGLVVGCGDTEQTPVEDEGSKPPNVRDLPRLGELLGPLDEDRIKVAPPRSWHIPPRSSKYIAHFQLSRRADYPHIFVTAEEYESVSNVTEDNVEEFAKQIAAALEEDEKVSKLHDPVRPITIGEFVGAGHRRRGKERGMVIERVFVETVVGFRKYCFELRALVGTLREFRPHLWAVAAGTEFLPADAPEPPKTLTQRP